MSAERDQDQAFLRSFGIIMLILVVIAVGFFFGARIISAVSEPHGPHPEQKLLAQQRTQPAYRVVTDASALQETAANGGAAKAGPAKSGEEVFKAVCHTCHVPGLLGAPKVTDTAEWKKRLAEQGIDTLHDNAIHGIGKMPPKGGQASLSDDEVIAAVNYILKTAGVKNAEAETSNKTKEGKGKGENGTNNSHEKTETNADTGSAAAQTDSGDEAQTAGKKATEDNAAADGGKAENSEEANAASAADSAIDAQAANTAGKKVFKALCHTCHVPGIAGAPKVSDKAEWTKRLTEQGLDKLHYNAIHGLGAMPPKGGNTALSDDDVIAAVNYMLLKSGAK